MNQSFKRTDKQKEQTKVLAGKARHAMSYGGSRSGKTFGICRAMILRAAKEQSRHLALRLNFNHAKTSLWHETFPKVFRLCFPDLIYEQNKTDYYYTLENDSEIWVGGLDDDKRVEKILGKEYSTMFFNECSQIPYGSIQLALTRLAEKNNLVKRAYYDENPPTKKHWSYPLFVKGLDPETWEPRRDSENYSSILMNPTDNIDNIDGDYLDLLSNLPEKDRQRFMDGEFTDDSNGNIYYSFDREKHVKPVTRDDKIPLWFGMDFNVDPMTAVVCQIVGDKIHVVSEVYLANSNTYEMSEVLKSRFPGRWNIVPDSTGKALKTSSAGLSDHQILKNAGFVILSTRNPFRMDRYNCVNNLLEKNRLVIDPKCVKTIRDLEQVSFKEGTNLPDDRIKSLTHISDALGYLCNHLFPITIIQTSASTFSR